MLDMRNLSQVRTTLFKNSQTSAEILNIYKAIIPSADIASGQVPHRATDLEKACSEYQFVQSLFRLTFASPINVTSILKLENKTV